MEYPDTYRCSLAGALLGDPYSTGILGWHYQEGLGVEKDIKKQINIMKKAHLGDVLSKYNLAKNLSEGVGLPVDQTRAFKLVKEAAETGYDIAEAELAYYYLPINWYTG